MNCKIELIGNNFILEELSKLLKDKDSSIVSENGVFYLKSECMDALSNYNKVNIKLNEILYYMNIVAKIDLDSMEVIKHNTITQLDENETVTHIFIDAKLVISGSAHLSQPSLSDENKIYCSVSDLMKIAKDDNNVRKVFGQIYNEYNSRNESDSWVIIYNICEILRDDNYKEIIKGGMYYKKAELLRRTANHYRHTNFPLPINAMTFLEAKPFINMVLHEWLTQKEHELSKQNKCID